MRGCPGGGAELVRSLQHADVGPFGINNDLGRFEVCYLKSSAIILIPRKDNGPSQKNFGSGQRIFDSKSGQKWMRFGSI